MGVDVSHLEVITHIDVCLSHMDIIISDVSTGIDDSNTLLLHSVLHFNPLKLIIIIRFTIFIYIKIIFIVYY